MPLTRWAGIDEAGYGPNLGPLVMVAVVAESRSADASRDVARPDLWLDLRDTVRRAGDHGARHRLLLDDSKAIVQRKRGCDQLELTCFSALAACAAASTSAPNADLVAPAHPTSLGALLKAVGAGTLADAEISLWLDGNDPPLPRFAAPEVVLAAPRARPFETQAWRLVDIRAAVVGPQRMNAGIERTGSKATVHFDAFATLLRTLWTDLPAGSTAHLRGDKHGGRNFYRDLLQAALAESAVESLVEGASASRYVARSNSKTMTIELMPRADGDDGLTALASMFAKLIREIWMAAFNDHWLARIPNLKPTAGYPVDAKRFRDAVEPACRDRGLDLDAWWRRK